MSTEEGIRTGLNAAAIHLEDEANECEKKADRMSDVFGSGVRVAALREHVNLLRRQAAQIRKLHVTRGR